MIKLFSRNKNSDIPDVPYDPSRQRATVRSSICTGEKTIGFKDIKTGKYTEVMFIHNEYDITRFMEKYKIDSVEKEY